MARFEMASPEMAAAGQDASGDVLFQLGMMYATGRDVDYNLVAAHKWFNLAVQRGKSEAAQYRQEIALELSHAEVAEAQRAAREWMRLH